MCRSLGSVLNTARKFGRTLGRIGSGNGPGDVHLRSMRSGEDRPKEMADAMKAMAHDLGFELAGIAPVGRSEHEAYVREWIASGQGGTMQWLTRHLEAMVDVRALMPEAKSVLCVAANYHYPLEEINGKDRGRIARYALGDDYHDVFRSRLHALADQMRARWPGTLTKCCVDTSPILEREYAAKAGIGWVGKNTCIIHPRLGSWLLLGEVITSAELPPDRPATDHCGTCRRCIDACPTGAIVAPYQMDARKCISYLNIEHRGGLSDDQQRQLGSWLVGCDICQEVCPFNRKAPEGTMSELRPRRPDGAADLRQIATWTEDDYRREFRKSAVRRVKLPVLKGNAAAVLRNTEVRDDHV